MLATHLPAAHPSLTAACCLPVDCACACAAGLGCVDHPILQEPDTAADTEWCVMGGCSAPKVACCSSDKGVCLQQHRSEAMQKRLALACEWLCAADAVDEFICVACSLGEDPQEPSQLPQASLNSLCAERTVLMLLHQKLGFLPCLWVNVPGWRHMVQADSECRSHTLAECWCTGPGWCLLACGASQRVLYGCVGCVAARSMYTCGLTVCECVWIVRVCKQTKAAQLWGGWGGLWCCRGLLDAAAV